MMNSRGMRQVGEEGGTDGGLSHLSSWTTTLLATTLSQQPLSKPRQPALAFNQQRLAIVTQWWQKYLRQSDVVRRVIPCYLHFHDFGNLLSYFFSLPLSIGESKDQTPLLAS